MTPEQLRIRARVGAHALHAKYDSRALTQHAREAAFQRFVDEVDPDRLLHPDERLRRARHAQRAWMTKLALKSSIARSRSHQP